MPEGVCVIVIDAFANNSPVSAATLPRIDDVVVFANALTDTPSDIAIVTAAEMYLRDLGIYLTSLAGKIVG